MNLNQLNLAGNMTRDPELRFTPKGMAICKFGLAINRKWKSESGEMKEEATFVDVDVFGKTAEAIAQYFKKGRGIFVTGRLKLDEWTDKQSGQKRSKLGVVCESFQFTDSRPDGEARPAARQAAATPAPADDDNPPRDPDDIPFN